MTLYIEHLKKKFTYYSPTFRFKLRPSLHHLVNFILPHQRTHLWFTFVSCHCSSGRTTAASLLLTSILTIVIVAVTCNSSTARACTLTPSVLLKFQCTYRSSLGALLKFQCTFQVSVRFSNFSSLIEFRCSSLIEFRCTFPKLNCISQLHMQFLHFTCNSSISHAIPILHMQIDYFTCNLKTSLELLNYTVCAFLNFTCSSPRYCGDFQLHVHKYLFLTSSLSTSLLCQKFAGLDLQRYIRICVFITYYFTTTGAPESKSICTIYFVKEFVVGSEKIVRFITITIMIKIPLASSSPKKKSINETQLEQLCLEHYSTFFDI